MTNKLDNILNDPLLNDSEKFDEIKSLISTTKNKLEQDVLLGTKDVNQIIDL